MNEISPLGKNPNNYEVGDIVRLATWEQLLEKWSDFIEYRNGEPIINDRFFHLAEWQDNGNKVRGHLSEMYLMRNLTKQVLKRTVWFGEKSRTLIRT